jgi:hypothetical protein
MRRSHWRSESWVTPRSENFQQAAERIYRDWDEALSNAPDAVLETSGAADDGHHCAPTTEPAFAPMATEQ